MEKQIQKRFSEMAGVEEISDLAYGMDFRLPQYRREVFLRFYEFHLIYNSHPGGVYFAFPWLSEYLNMNMEQKLWIAFLNGCSQNIVTSYILFCNFPSLKELNIDKMEDWWNNNHMKFKAGSGWDSDRKYFKIGKTGLINCIRSYQKAVEKFGTQETMFGELTSQETEYKNFESVWKFVRENFLSFGRLSTFSYTEYLRIQGLPLNCNNLFLEDIDGSMSHRNGLCKVLGRDDLDWWKVEGSPTKDFQGYEPETIQWLKSEADLLLSEAQQRLEESMNVDTRHINFFTLESTLCCYKSWHRPNRRYPNVYMDMFYNRIKYAEESWGDIFELFWKMREDSLPKELRQEENPKDPGLSKEKQNHYRLTGQVIMMDKEWDCFQNEFNDKIRLGE